MKKISKLLEALKSEDDWVFLSTQLIAMTYDGIAAKDGIETAEKWFSDLEKTFKQAG